MPYGYSENGLRARVVFLITGVLFIMVGSRFKDVANDAFKGGIVGEARYADHVIGTKYSIDRQEDVTVYYPVIAFTAVDGKEYRFQSSLSQEIAPIRGASTQVYYDPTNPKAATHYTLDNPLFGGSALPIAAGIAMIVLSLLSFLKRGADGGTPVVVDALQAKVDALPPLQGVTQGLSADAKPVPRELTDYIRRAVADRKSKSRIRAELLEAGWDQGDVDAALKDR